MKKIVGIYLLLIFIKPCFSQDLLEGDKPWYSLYINHTLNKKIYIDDCLLASFNGLQHSFSFLQNDISFNYRCSKKVDVYFRYSYAAYNWTRAYKEVYAQPVSVFNTIGFNRIAIGGKYDLKFRKYWRFDQELGAQFYFPQLEKYQYRFQYNVRLTYRRKKMPMRLRPFVQASLFYYLNGIPDFYYNEDGSLGEYKSPDGLHRYRVKYGVSFRPVKSIKKLNMVLYYNTQKEFNLPGLGNDLNVTSPLQESKDIQRIKYPLNNYNVYGIQLNLFL